MTITLETKSPEHTRELAAAIASVVRPGDTILLAGDLGAGKTTFTQGLGRAFGVDHQITSPTFTLMHEYRGTSLTLVHVDVYRVGRLQEIVDLGLEEMLDEGAVAVVEWGDVAEPALPPDFLEIRIAFGDADDDRRFTLRTVGTGWGARVESLRAAVGRWTA